MSEQVKQFVLKQGTKVCDFVMANNDVDYIQGPIGSGKTRGMVARILRHAQQQRLSKLTARRMSRWAVVRNTYPDLKTTTIRTWLEIVDENLYGRFNWGQPPHHKLLFGEIDLHVDFLALDKPEDVRKLRSTEYTGIAFNELPFLDKELFDEAASRLRYPGVEHGGSEWHGVIADGNAPDEDSWVAWMTGQVDLPPNMTDEEREQYIWPPHWGLYMQPPAVMEKRDSKGIVIGYTVNPAAENLGNLRAGYYEKMLYGKSKPWIDSRLRNVVALVVPGAAVWPMFRVETHVANEVLRPNGLYDVIVGLDFGRTPAAVFLQSINNRVLVQHELIGHNMGAETFAPQVRSFITKNYYDCNVMAFGDPKGQDRTQNDERTAFDIYAVNGIKVRAPPGLKQNMIETRVSAVANVLNEMSDGRPRFLMSPMCRTLKVAMAGRYHNERDEQGELRPCKDRYSHISDALQYAILGIGEGGRMIGRPFGDLEPKRVWKEARRSMRRIQA